MNPYGNDMIVDQVIGSAYQVVRYVAANMETLIELSDAMDTIQSVLGELQTIIDNMPALLEVSGNIPDLLELHSHLSELLVIYTNLSMLANIHNSLDDIQIIADNLDILSSNIALLNSNREALRRSYAEAGYNLVDGSFEVGGTLVNSNDVLLQERTGKAFSGPAGTVAAGTNPVSGGFVDRSAVITQINAESFGVSTQSADNTSALQTAVDYCVSLGTGVNTYPPLFIDFSRNQVYEMLGEVDFKGVPLIGNAGPERVLPTPYEYSRATTRACILLNSATAKAKNIRVAENISIVCARGVHNTHAVEHTRRLGVKFKNAGIFHAGQNNLHLPYGAIPLFFTDGSTAYRANGHNIWVGDADDGTGNPDRDTNRVDLNRSSIQFGHLGNFTMRARGGTFVIRGSDITKAGEPTETLPANSAAFAVDIEITGGTNSGNLHIEDSWFEKNYNMLRLAGTMRTVRVAGLRQSAYTDNAGVMLDLAGFIYDADFSGVMFSGPRYKYLLDASGFGFDASGKVRAWQNNIDIQSTVKGWYEPFDISVSDNVRFARYHGGMSIGTLATGAVTGKGGTAIYTLDTSKIPSGSGLNPIPGQATWFVNNGQGADISVVIGGVYAGEIVTSGTTTITTTKDVAIGNGSVEFFVRKKVYDNITKPFSYGQTPVLEI